MGEAIAEVGYLAGVCGHDGTDWQKLRIGALFNFESIVGKSVDHDSAAATNEIESSSPDTGKIWVITNIATRNYDGGISAKVEIYVKHDDNYYLLDQYWGALVQYQFFTWQGEVCLDAGDTIYVAQNNVTPGDTGQLTIYGYQMDAP